MSDVKPLTKIEWMKKELAKDGFYPSEQGIKRVLRGDQPEFFEDEMIDVILDAGYEWDDSNQ